MIKLTNEFGVPYSELKETNLLMPAISIMSEELSFAKDLTPGDHARAAKWLVTNREKNLTRRGKAVLSEELAGHLVRGVSELSDEEALAVINALATIA